MQNQGHAKEHQAAVHLIRRGARPRPAAAPRALRHPGLRLHRAQAGVSHAARTRRILTSGVYILMEGMCQQR